MVMAINQLLHYHHDDYDGDHDDTGIVTGKNEGT
jgi:hypothetical protein